MHKCSGKMVLKPDFKELSGRSGRENGQNGPLNLDLSIVVKRKIYITSLQDRSPNRFEIMLDLLVWQLLRHLWTVHVIGDIFLAH